MVEVDDGFFAPSEITESTLVDPTTTIIKDAATGETSKAARQPPETVANKDSGVISKYNLRPKKPSIIDRLKNKSSSHKKKITFQQD